MELLQFVFEIFVEFFWEHVHDLLWNWILSFWN